MRLSSINDLPYFLLLLIRKLDTSACPVLLQSVNLRRARDRDHALRDHPGKRNLRDRAAFLVGKLLNLFYNSLVLVEVLTLKFGRCTAEVVWCEIIRAVVVKVVDKPAVTER